MGIDGLIVECVCTCVLGIDIMTGARCAIGRLKVAQSLAIQRHTRLLERYQCSTMRLQSDAEKQQLSGEHYATYVALLGSINGTVLSQWLVAMQSWDARVAARSFEHADLGWLWQLSRSAIQSLIE